MNKTPKLLIVDDEAVSRQVLEHMLSSEGYELHFAENGVEALAMLELHPIDIVLLDVMMPGVDGFEVCEEIKGNDKWQHIPVVLVTALGGKMDQVKGLDLGADDFLSKPVNKPELLARVRSMLRIRQQFNNLQDLLKLREDLSNMLVHDMRNPLTTIIGTCQTMLHLTENNEDIEKDVQRIFDSSIRLNSFVDDMLLLAKMEENRLVLNNLNTDLRDLFKNIVASHQFVAGSENVELEFEPPPFPVFASIDSNLFHRVFDNLLSNSLKYAPSGSKVSIHLESLGCGINGMGAGPTTRIKVIDEGPGIEDEMRTKVFDKFEIVKLKQNGGSQIGLGLAFCKMVVEAHGGVIFVDPNKPRGSVFTVEL